VLEHDDGALTQHLPQKGIRTMNDRTENTRPAAAGPDQAGQDSHNKQCPSWCENSDCKGEHQAVVEDYLPTSGGLPSVSHETGTWFPAVAVSVTWDTIDELSPCVTLHVSGPGTDTQIDLLPHEARALAEAITAGVETLRATASSPHEGGRVRRASRGVG
jgi:hypothetical protein